MKKELFKQLLASNTELLNILTDLEDKLQGQHVFGMSYVRSQSARCVFHTMRMIQSLNEPSANRYAKLMSVLEMVNGRIKDELEQRREAPLTDLVLPYWQIHRDMVDFVGGKSANLGEVLNRVQLPVAEGFAITTLAFDTLLAHNDLVDDINTIKMSLHINNPESIQTASEDIQRLIISAKVPPELPAAIRDAYGLVMSAEVPPEDLVAPAAEVTGPGRMVRNEFARTASRLREMQSRDYFARKHASAQDPRVLRAR